MTINHDKFRLPPEQFCQRSTPKKQVVLHFTAGGSAAGAYSAWMRDPMRVGTAYIVERDGTVFEIFPPDMWAFHLGAPRPDLEWESIGIELVNYGPLKLTAGKLCAWPGNYTMPICKLDQRDQYVQSAYRGMTYWQSFPLVQVAAAAELVKQLCAVFRIERRLLPDKLRYACCPGDVFGWNGIVAHQNIRADKYDIGPAFPMESVVA